MVVRKSWIGGGDMLGWPLVALVVVVGVGWYLGGKRWRWVGPFTTRRARGARAGSPDRHARSSSRAPPPPHRPRARRDAGDRYSACHKYSTRLPPRTRVHRPSLPPRHRPTMPSPRLPRPTRFLVGRTYATASANSWSTKLSPTARAKAMEISTNWKGTSATGKLTKNFIGGEFVESSTDEWIDVHDPVCLCWVLAV